MERRHLYEIAAVKILFRYPVLKRNLHQAGTALTEIFSLNEKALRDMGVKEEDIRAIHSRPEDVGAREAHRCEENGVRLVFLNEKDYPPLLGEIFNPPPYIYVKGDPGVLSSEKIAVVGSRRATAYGRFVMQSMIPDLCLSGLTVVSGMAYGIDSLAHRLTIRVKGITIGVNAGGLLHLNPPGNHALIHEIVERGCVVSEFPLDTVPRPHLFPIRNRLIAGLARATVVVEAAPRSGSLITARLALEQNREVLAVPGRIDSRQSQGTNHLIASGAKLVQNSNDVLEEFGMVIKPGKTRNPTPVSPEELRILDLMDGNEVKRIDDFVEHLGLPVSAVVSILMGLRLKNLVVETEGGFQRRI